MDGRALRLDGTWIVKVGGERREVDEDKMDGERRVLEQLYMFERGS